MNDRVTLLDIAREAGVSAATVDRVLNNRSGVHRRTRDVVMMVAVRLGYTTASGGETAAHPALMRLVVLLPEGTNAFMDRLEWMLAARAGQLGTVDLRVERVPAFNPTGLAACLLACRGTVDGLAVVAQDHPQVREAIRTLVADQIPVVTLCTDVLSTPRVAYVGIDNRQAGRLAGHLLGRFLVAIPRPRVAMFAGSLSYRGHEEREMGFRHIVREEFPAVEIVQMVEVLDDIEKAYRAAKTILAAFPDLDGIYSVGAGIAGIARALHERKGGRRVVLIGHEVTADTKQLLLDGTLDATIDQNPRVEAREALNLLISAIRQERYTYIPPRIQVIFRENIPDDG